MNSLQFFRLAVFLAVFGINGLSQDPVGPIPQTTFAQTSLGFYWPLGGGNFSQGVGSWLMRDSKYGGRYVFDNVFHTGVDMLANAGDPVYAIANGTVFAISKHGWGTGNVAILIRHQRSDGGSFLAMYGHVQCNLKVYDMVTGGVQFAIVGPYQFGSHLHFGIHPTIKSPSSNGLVSDPGTIGFGMMGDNFWPMSNINPGQPADTNEANSIINSDPNRADYITDGFVDPLAYLQGVAQPFNSPILGPLCQNGSSIRYTPNGNIPIHPDGTVVKLSTSQAIYVLKWPRMYLIPSRTTLQNLYGLGKGFDFRDVITVSPSELNLYTNAGIVPNPLPSNGRNEPDGRLIQQWGNQQISLITTDVSGKDGARIPFSSGSNFLNLGYAQCNIAGVSDYFNGYPDPGTTTVENWTRPNYVVATGYPPPTPPVFKDSTSVTPSLSGISQPITVNTSITNTNLNSDNSVNNTIVDIEIFNSLGSQVNQTFFPNEFFTVGVPNSYTFTWTPTSQDTYIVKVAVFEDQWAKTLYWDNSAFAFTIGNNPLPTYVIDMWWPTDGSTVSGVQPFKGLLKNNTLSSYVMYWQVDNGQLNLMPDNQIGYPHKEADVDLSGWTWKGAGPYVVNFVAQDLTGNTLAQKSANITITH